MLTAAGPLRYTGFADREFHRQFSGISHMSSFPGQRTYFALTFIVSVLFNQDHHFDHGVQESASKPGAASLPTRRLDQQNRLGFPLTISTAPFQFRHFYEAIHG